MEPKKMNRGRESIYRKTKYMRSEFLNSKTDSQPDTIPFSYRAAKALNENIYRNVLFDTWRDEAITSGFLEELGDCLTQVEKPDNLSEPVDETMPDGVLRGANGNIPSNVMSAYDKAIRVGCLGLKQHIHWHSPQQKSLLRKVLHYRSQETTKVYQPPMPPRFCKPIAYMNDAFKLSMLINWLQQNKLYDLWQTRESTMENNEHRARLSLEAVPNTVLSNTQGVWPPSWIRCW
ncbi:hypothetical protein PHET_04456 [Paragonimus heterotremus]|uniref:Uncharacterized protein n=1 Tax=Paragonimus heterotremus TaxID=100268 RepID=A0A8J4WI98_9TREM|nr:hypothetical protein PHET_04456 [Paragonimus heterotremus]